MTDAVLDRRAAALPSTGWWRAAAVPSTNTSGTPLAFRALLVFLFLLLLSPQNLVPALASLRPALIAGGLAVGACLVGRFVDRGAIRRTAPELRVAAALGAWAILTIPLSYWPGGSVKVLLDLYLKALALFWLLASLVDTRERLRQVVAALTLMGLPLAVTGMWNYASGTFLDAAAAHVPRIAGYHSGLAGNPNDLALVLNLLVPLALGLALSRSSRRGRAAGFMAALVLAAGVVVTFSRAGFVALVSTVLLHAVKSVRRGRVAPVGGLVLFCLLALPLLPTGYVSRVASIADVDSDPTGSAQTRWADTLAALRVMAARPVVGTGLGTNILALNEERGASWTAVHNVYLEHGVELGLPGLTLFVGLLVSSLRSARRARQDAGRAGHLEVESLSEGVEVALVAFAVSGFFYPVAYHFYFYLVAGLAAAVGALPVLAEDAA
jgi:putative inorganic carbon (hco3(-)) transporter